MFPFSTGTPFIFPTFFYGNAQQPAPQYFQPMIFPFGIMGQQAPPQQHFGGVAEQIQNSEQD